ncbi:UNVERIFIED_CONTAM: hypothetical protein RF648_19245, partial [Kocuria sp. CPCC 205274]
EVEQNEDGLFPLVYNMLANRLNAAALLNQMYGLTVDVDFGSVWADKQKELVDGNPENNTEPDNQPTTETPEPDNQQEPDSSEETNQEQEQAGDDNGDGDGERGQSPDTETETGEEVETEVEPEPLIVDPENPVEEESNVRD